MASGSGFYSITVAGAASDLSTLYAERIAAPTSRYSDLCDRKHQMSRRDYPRWDETSTGNCRREPALAVHGTRAGRLPCCVRRANMGIPTSGERVTVNSDDTRARSVFMEVHSGLPREGPGDRASTGRAIALAQPLPASADVLDIACGPGEQTVHLAQLLPAARIQAVDYHRPFVEEASRRVATAGAGHRVKVSVADMRALPFETGQFDLIWCEGAAYNMGLTNALTQWRSLLRSDGKLAFTEAVWLRDDPPDELHDWWMAGYPDMGSANASLELVSRCGYRLLGSFVLPDHAWWERYYHPMEDRLTILEEKYNGDPEAMAVLEDCRLEIDYYRRYSDCYGYLFVVAIRES